MKLTAQPPYLCQLEWLATHDEEDNAFSDIDLYTLFP